MMYHIFACGIVDDGKRHLRADYTIEYDFPPSTEPHVSSRRSGPLVSLGDISLIYSPVI